MAATAWNSRMPKEAAGHGWVARLLLLAQHLQHEGGRRQAEAEARHQRGHQAKP